VGRSRHRYGTKRGQVGDLWLPDGATDDLPVVVLVHGGFWRGLYGKPLMNKLAEAVTKRGWAAWNVEYRRVGAFGGGGGWPETFADVATAIDHVAQLQGVDPDRVATLGHSAGGHLALWAAGRGRIEPGYPGAVIEVPLRGAIALAGVVDLAQGARSGLGAGAVTDLMGGTPDQYPDRYRNGSPAELLPLGVPQALLHGLIDAAVPASMSEDYQHRASAVGDDVTYVPLDGLDHRAMIDPATLAWPAAAEHLERFLA
jgi:acetyl esterase/lipase